MSSQNGSTGLPAIARKVFLTGTVLVLGGAALVGCVGRGPTHTETKQLSFHHRIDRIEFDLDSGNITLTRGEQGQVGIGRTLTWTDDRPVFKEEWQGNVLRITSKCDGRHCSADYKVQLPSSVQVDASTEAGVISTQAVQGDQQLKTDSGDIRVTDAAGRLSASVKSGNITADGLASASASATSQAGNLSMGFVRAPAQVTARAQSGNVNVKVPHTGQQYRVQADTDAGQKSVKVAQSSTGQGAITAHSDAGNIDIDYA
ncbi:DUF4097 family beta strand repeat-containing protein [Streptomyces sp. NPDC007971]|uniref:DUF4097 family beta strand repeat-containing protein n=1 Tax=Streptomyces sp. NPDC007971 TaxID=3364799 RepID=UPI0036E04D03